MGTKVTTQKKVEPIKYEAEFRLNKARQVYKDYPIISNPISIDNEEFDKGNKDNNKESNKYYYNNVY